MVIQQGCQATDLTYSGSPRTVMEWSGLMTLANFVATMYLSRLPPFSALAAGSQYHLVSRVCRCSIRKHRCGQGKAEAASLWQANDSPISCSFLPTP